MRALLRALALAALASGLLLWLSAGANLGWTKTSVPVRKLDRVTGIEAIEYEERFVPGVDFLGLSVLGAAVFAGASCFCGAKQQRTLSVL